MGLHFFYYTLCQHDAPSPKTSNSSAVIDAGSDCRVRLAIWSHEPRGISGVGFETAAIRVFLSWAYQAYQPFMGIWFIVANGYIILYNMECNSPTDVWVCLKMAIDSQKRCLFMRRMISLANGVWLVKSRSLALESPLLSPKNGWWKPLKPTVLMMKSPVCQVKARVFPTFQPWGRYRGVVSQSYVRLGWTPNLDPRMADVTSVCELSGWIQWFMVDVTIVNGGYNGLLT